MSGFGMFEANVTSDAEEKRHVREAANKLAAATYDVRERFGQFLFGSKDLTEYTDRLALSKNDILKTIEPHVFPRTGTVRRVLKPLEDEFKSRQAKRASRRTAAPEDEAIFGGGGRFGGDDDGALGGAGGSSSLGNGLIGPGAFGPSPGGYPVTQAQIDSIGGSDAFQGKGKGLGDNAPAAASGNGGNGGGGNGGGGSDWSPNGNTDSIGAGNYDIQSGDTLTTISERAGLGADGVSSLAEANGIDNPDMIYAGDSLTIPGGTDTSTSTTTPDASTPEPGGPAPTSGVPGVPGAPTALPTESSNLTPTSGAPDTTQMSNPDNSMTNPGLTSVSNRRAAARRRYAEFEGELEPEGDWKGYLSDVDEGDEGRTTNNFGGTFPGGTDHNGDPAKTDFVKDSTRRFALWCKANRRLANLDSLESYAPSDREYIAIAATMQRVAKPVGPEWNSKGKPKINKPTKPGPMELHQSPEPGSGFSDKPQPSPEFGSTKAAAAGDHWSYPSGGKHSLEKNWDGYGEDPYDSSYGDEKEITLLPRQQVKKSIPKHRAEAGKHDSPFGNQVTDVFGEMGDVAYPPELVGDSGFPSEPPMMKRVKGKPSKHRDPQHRPGSGQYPNTLQSIYEGGEPSDETKIEFFRDRSGRRRTAAPDYLQKADEALTNLLNQKAEEFQGQIAPLQQALQTVQQAEQEAAAANPMNVMPPAGTVNVMPGGDPSGGAGGGLDPNALAAMMGGGDPNAGGGDPMGGADPSMGGGAPPGLDPNAMGGAPPAAQDQGLPPMMAARLRFARLHQAKNCECWDGYERVPGTKPCAKGSCQKCDTHKESSRRRANGVVPPDDTEPHRRMEYIRTHGGSPEDVQVERRRRDALEKQHEASRRRQAKNVDQMWEEFAANATQRGGEPDVDAFAQRYKVGPVALKRIRQKISAGNRKRGGQGKGRRASAHTSTRRQAWSGWGGASLSMQRVAGWDFDHRLNGYITTAADTFSCDCGDEFSTPSGYRKCGSCGRAWNSYVIGTDNHGKEASLEKVICREIPVRKDVIVASRRQADKHTLRRIDLRDMMDQEPEEDKPEIEHFAARRVAADGMSYEDTMAHIDKTLAEGERPRNPMQCIDCGGEALAPTSDWSQSRGVPFDNDNKWQFYYERGDSHPEEYGDVPQHWAPFGSWESSGFCKNCHPGNPKKQARRTAGDWNRNPDKDWPLDDGDWGGPKKKKKNKDFDGPDDPMFGFNSLGIDGPGPKGPSPRYYAARSYVAQCRRARRRPTPEGLRRFMMAEHFDITEEGGTPKGKGKPSKKTTMSTPDAQWYRRNRGGRYT